jgi:hypothetical protein
VRLISTATKTVAFMALGAAAACSSSSPGVSSGAPAGPNDGGLTASTDDGGGTSVPVTSGSVPAIGGCPVFPADNPGLAKVHGSDFEAIETGPISTAGL